MAYYCEKSSVCPIDKMGLKLAEYEFEIEHKPGKKHINADSLSRHIANVKPEEATLKETSDPTEIGLIREVVME